MEDYIVDEMVEKLSEADAFALVRGFTRKFRWAVGGIVSIADIHEEWFRMYGEQPSEEDIDRVVSRWEYRRLADALADQRYECLLTAIDDVRFYNTKGIAQ